MTADPPVCDACQEPFLEGETPIEVEEIGKICTECKEHFDNEQAQYEEELHESQKYEEDPGA